MTNAQINSNGWNTLPCGYEVLLEDGQPVRISDNGKTEPVEYTLLQAEIAEISGMTVQWNNNGWSAADGEPDTTVKINQEIE